MLSLSIQVLTEEILPTLPGVMFGRPIRIFGAPEYATNRVFTNW
jgi:hypothetical protein